MYYYQIWNKHSPTTLNNRGGGSRLFLSPLAKNNSKGTGRKGNKKDIKIQKNSTKRDMKVQKMKQKISIFKSFNILNHIFFRDENFYRQVYLYLPRLT